MGLVKCPICHKLVSKGLYQRSHTSREDLIIVNCTAIRCCACNILLFAAVNTRSRELLKTLNNFKIYSIPQIDQYPIEDSDQGTFINYGIDYLWA